MAHPRFLAFDILIIIVAATPLNAGTITYEGFDHTDIGANLSGKSGGVGFTGEWGRFVHPAVGTDTNYSVAEGTLTFSDLATQGNRVSTTQLSAIGGIGRDFSEPISRDDNVTKYLSFLLRPEGTVGQGNADGFFGVILDAGTDILIGKPGTQAPDSRKYVIEDLGGARHHASDIPVVADVTTFLVVKAELTSSTDTFTLYMNPIPGQPEPQTGVVKSDVNVRDVTGVGFAGAGAFSVDEIRWGDTFADVTRQLTGSACDLDGNSVCDTVDIDLLLDAFGTNDSHFDINLSGGVIDHADLEEWLILAGTENLGNPYVSGDTNLDGKVGSNDLNDLALNWRIVDATSWTQGDFNGDGSVDAIDLNEIGRSWQSGVVTAASPQGVPEPSSTLLLLGGTALLTCRRRRDCQC